MIRAPSKKWTYFVVVVDVVVSPWSSPSQAMHSNFIHRAGRSIARSHLHRHYPWFFWLPFIQSKTALVVWHGCFTIIVVWLLLLNFIQICANKKRERIVPLKVKCLFSRREHWEASKMETNGEQKKKMRSLFVFHIHIRAMCVRRILCDIGLDTAQFEYSSDCCDVTHISFFIFHPNTNSPKRLIFHHPGSGGEMRERRSKCWRSQD